MSLKWFAIGLGVGAGVAILSTPKTGAEMRDMLKDIPDKARRYAAGKIEEEHYTITDVINEINESKKVVTDAAADTLSEASKKNQPEPKCNRPIGLAGSSTSDAVAEATANCAL